MLAIARGGYDADFVIDASIAQLAEWASPANGLAQRQKLTIGAATAAEERKLGG